MCLARKCVAAGLMAVMLFAEGVLAAEPEVGGNIEGLLAAMRLGHPALLAHQSEEEAIGEEAIVAGALDDPSFSLRLEDITAPTGVPRAFGTTYYSLAQSFPLGGKRGAREALVLASGEKVRRTRILTQAELELEMKIAFAERYLGLALTKKTEQLIDILGDIVRVAEVQITQGAGTQSEIIEAEIDIAKLKDDLFEEERLRNQAQSRINLILGRDSAAPLANPVDFPPIPGDAEMDLAALIQRAGANSPDVGLPQADILSAEKEKDLAKSEWWPDVTVRGTVVQGYGSVGYTDGYEAEVGLNIPLQWGRREAAEKAADKKLASANHHQDEARRAVAIKIQDYYWRFIAAKKQERLLGTEIIPKLHNAVDAAQNSFAIGKGSLINIVTIIRQLKENERRVLQARFAQYEMIASIERLLGEPL